jgi:simple sugar transport system permease protein
MLESARKLAGARETITLGLALVLLVLFTYLTGGSFVEGRVLRVMAISAAEMGIIAVGVALLMISGEFDLSVGSVAALGAFVTASLFEMGMDPFVAMVLAVAVGIAAGAFNGLLTVGLGIPSFIVTLGTLMMWRGVVTVATEGETVRFLARETDPAFHEFLQRDLGLVSAPLLWFIAIIVVFVALLNYTRFGNHVFASGGNKDAARAMGIPVARTKIRCFMIVGGLAAFAGVLQVTRIRGFQALQGEGMELMVIAAVVVGGTSLFGGVGTIIGAALGVLIITFIRFGLIMSGVPGFWFRLVVGVVIVSVVALNVTIERMKARVGA